MKTSAKLALRKLLPALAAAVALTAQAGPASAATNNQGFHMTYAGSLSKAISDGRPVVGTGRVNGRGVEKLITEHWDLATGEFVDVTDFVFPEGSLRLQVTAKEDPLKSFGNDCYAEGTIHGSYEVLGGTGQLSGAAGAGTVAGWNQVFGNRSGRGCQYTDCQINSEINFKGWIDLPR